MPQVMPIMIRILCHHKSEINMYDKDQNVLIDIRQPAVRNTGLPHKYIELTDALYCEILSLSDIDDISAFCAKYPDIRFFFKGQQAVGFYKEIVTEKVYYFAIKRQIDFFRNYMSNYELIQRLDSLSDEETIEIYDTFSEWQKYFQRFGTTRRHTEETHFYNAVCDCGLTDRLSDIKPDFFFRRKLIGVKGNIPDQEKNNIIWQFKKQFVQDNKKSFINILPYITEDNITVFDTNTDIINYECPTVLSAMYAMLVVSEFNKNTYKMCAHPGCHNYFLVDKTHPQTRCPEHMKSRQTRRQNARTKEILNNVDILRDKKQAQALEIQRAETKYERTKNIDEYISFWESIWSGDRRFLSKNNSQAFTLADLYIQQGRYQDAMKFVMDIGKKEWFSEKAAEYIKKINALMAADSKSDQ